MTKNREEELNTLAKIEKAIVEKYGKKALYNASEGWTPEKEKSYLEEIKKLSREERENLNDVLEKYEINGILVENSLFIKDTVERICPVCKIYSFDSKDDIYMKRYRCCQKCYYEFVDGREERWNSGWRPSEERVNGRKSKSN